MQTSTPPQQLNGNNTTPATFAASIEKWLDGNQPAIEWIQYMLFVASGWDDLVDRDTHMFRLDIDKLMETALSLCVHPFFLANAAQLYPLLHNAIRNWKIATTIERDTEADENALMQAFVLRSSYIDLIGACANIVKGGQWAETVTRLARLQNSREGFAAYKASLERERTIRGESNGMWH